MKVGDKTLYGVVTLVAHWGFIALTDDGIVNVETNLDWNDWRAMTLGTPI